MTNLPASPPSHGPDDPLLLRIPTGPAATYAAAKWIIDHLRTGGNIVPRERWFFDGLMALRQAGIVRVQIQPGRRTYAVTLNGGGK